MRARVLATVLVAGTLLSSASTAIADPVASASPPDPAAVVAGMTLAQRVGQVFMVGGTAIGVNPSTTSAVRDRHVGNVFLSGRSYAGTAATAQVTAGLQTLVTPDSTAEVPLFLATDQEGGKVQVLQGPGFSAIPTGLVQGGTDAGTLRANAASWGAELRAGGVTVNLAPVLDVMPSPQAAATNPPIGWYDRELGYNPATVAAHGVAFSQGMADAGVDVAVKHFPGLGRVTANTDDTSGVTDTVTTRDDPYLAPFAAAVQAGAPFLMMSTAYYARIDPANPAAFSSLIIGGLVRGDLGFRGVVISDSLSAGQLNPFPVGDRAVAFLAAGGDLALVSVPDQLPAMYDGVLNRATWDSGFRARVSDAALHVLVAKQARFPLPPANAPGPGPGPFEVLWAFFVAVLAHFHLFGF